MADKLLFVVAISQTQEGCATNGAAPEVVEITSEEGGGEVGDMTTVEFMGFSVSFNLLLSKNT